MVNKVQILQGIRTNWREL